jgi:flagellar biosynthetic protein FlhB
MGLDEILKNVAGSVQTLVRNAAAVGLVLAATDYIVQRRRMSGQLRMTRQEVKEEFRQSEGDPRVKNVLRSRQLSISRNRMIASVALADVVIVNPTHYAIALAYDPSRGAPEVVARGAGVLAAKVREEAELHHVPIVEDPPLTRTLFRCCQVGDLVPVELYEAVAHVLAFVMGLRRNAIAGVRRAPRRGPLPEVPSGRRRPRRLSSRPNRPIRSGDARTARTRTGHGR